LDVVRAYIEHASGGWLCITGAELFVKVKDAVDNGQFDTAINDEEACLIAHSFYALEDWSLGRFSESSGIPGYGHARTLLTGRLGLDIATFKACGYRSFKVKGLPGSGPRQPSAVTSMAPQDQARRVRTARELSDGMTSVEEQFWQGALSEQDFLARVRSIQADIRAIQPVPPGAPLPSLNDRVGWGSWPASHYSVGGFHLFHQDTGFLGPDAVNRAVPLWAVLREDQKDAYRAQAEAKRREAWADYETKLVRKDANPNAVFPLSAFELFRNEQVAGNGRGRL
jgi:hypothetical protein